MSPRRAERLRLVESRLSRQRCYPRRLPIAWWWPTTSRKSFAYPGTRGAAFLFLQWCQQRKGINLCKRLAQSNFHGIDNLEIAMEEPFADLFRAWTVDQILKPFSQPEGFRHLALGPFVQEVRFARIVKNWASLPPPPGISFYGPMCRAIIMSASKRVPKPICK